MVSHRKMSAVRLRVLLLAVTLAAGTGACDEGPLSPAERRELVAARDRWAGMGRVDYTVESRISCFCSPHLNIWTRLTVRAGIVVVADPVEALPNGITSSLLGWRTVDDLFTILDSLTGDVLEDLTARYDPTLGYPREITITCHPNILDCGSVYEMRNLSLQ